MTGPHHSSLASPSPRDQPLNVTPDRLPGRYAVVSCTSPDKSLQLSSAFPPPSSTLARDRKGMARRQSSKYSTEHALALLNGVNETDDGDRNSRRSDDANSFLSAVENTQNQSDNGEGPTRVSSKPLMTRSSPALPSNQGAQLRRPVRRRLFTGRNPEPRSDEIFRVPESPAVRRSTRLSLRAADSPRARRSSRLGQNARRSSAPDAMNHQYSDDDDDGENTHATEAMAVDTEENRSVDLGKTHEAEGMALDAEEDHAQDARPQAQVGTELLPGIADLEAAEEELRNWDPDENDDPASEENEKEEVEDSESDSESDNSWAGPRAENPPTPLKTSARAMNGPGSGNRVSGGSTGPTTRNRSRAGDASATPSRYSLRARKPERRQSVFDHVEIPGPSPRRRGRPRKSTRGGPQDAADVNREPANIEASGPQQDAQSIDGEPPDVDASGLQEHVQNIDREQRDTSGPRTPEDPHPYTSDADDTESPRERKARERKAREKARKEKEEKLFVEASRLLDQQDHWKTLVAKANVLRGHAASPDTKGRFQAIEDYMHELCGTYQDIRRLHSTGDRVPDDLLRDCQHLVEAISDLAFKIFDKAYRLCHRSGVRAEGLVNRLEVQVMPCIVDAAKECLKAHYRRAEGRLAPEGFDQLEAVLNLLLALCERSFTLRAEGYIPAAGRSRQLRLPLRRILQALRAEGFRRKVHGEHRPDAMDVSDDSGSEPERAWTEEEGVALLRGLQMFQGTFSLSLSLCLSLYIYIYIHI